MKFAEMPTKEGFFGEYGGQVIPPELKAIMDDIDQSYEQVSRTEAFQQELEELYADYVGRPSPIYHARRLSDQLGGARIFLKREDLNHTGAHKINHCLGEALLAKHMGKTKVLAETGAGQHGVALATACALVGIDCEIHMGEIDIAKEHPNVTKMKILGCKLVPVSRGTRTLKDAVDSAFEEYLKDPTHFFYAIGSVVGPHPFPKMVRDFQSVIGKEAREQIQEKAGQLPDSVVACAGGGSNTMGTFHAFVPDNGVDLYAVEAGGSSLEIDEDEGLAPNSATLSTGTDGVLHGAMTKLLQSTEGQIMESHSVSAGLDYAGVGPELSHLVETGRVTPASVDDEDALNGFHRLSRLEGIIPALESSHALGYLEEEYENLGDLVVVNVSGRGDKDLETVLEETEKRDLEAAPDVEVFDG